MHHDNNRISAEPGNRTYKNPLTQAPNPTDGETGGGRLDGRQNTRLRKAWQAARAEYYRNNRRTPRTEEQAGDIPTGGERPLLSMSGQSHGSMAKAAREEHHGLQLKVTCYQPCIRILPSSIRYNGNMIANESSLRDPGKGVCYHKFDRPMFQKQISDSNIATIIKIISVLFPLFFHEERPHPFISQGPLRYFIKKNPERPQGRAVFSDEIPCLLPVCVLRIV